jgi:hypothetical protein
MDILIGILIIILGIEIESKPRLDYTADRKLVLWYGKKQRKFVILCKF